MRWCWMTWFRKREFSRLPAQHKKMTFDQASVCVHWEYREWKYQKMNEVDGLAYRFLRIQSSSQEQSSWGNNNNHNNGNNKNNGYFQTPILKSSKRFTRSWRRRWCWMTWFHKGECSRLPAQRKKMTWKWLSHDPHFQTLREMSEWNRHFRKCLKVLGFSLNACFPT